MFIIFQYSNVDTYDFASYFFKMTVYKINALASTQKSDIWDDSHVGDDQSDFLNEDSQVKYR